MPLIEELPLSTPSRAQPGWAYVPEVSAQVAAAAAAAAAGQTTSRKRTRGVDTLGSQSAKQQKAIEQRLKDLEKENYKDVQIAIPKREGGDGGTATPAGAAAAGGKSQRDGKKTTSNVRRILGYNRTFAHYLADEEAAIQAGQQPYYMQGMNLPIATANQGKDKDAKRRDGTGTPTSSSRASTLQQQQQQQQQQSLGKTPSRVKSEQPQDVDMTGLSAGTPATPKSPHTQAPPGPGSSSPSTTQAPLAAPAPAPARAYPAHWDNDPLLRTLLLPARPSERVMQQLVAEPALSWNEARAKPLDAEKQTVPVPPPRHFCIMCGYWGKVKCRKCAERVCGAMECWRAHEAAGCGDRPY